MIDSVSDKNLTEVKAFLEQKRETALYLLSNLEAHGPSLTEDLNSGNFKCLMGPEGLQGVFCLTRRGSLLAQTEGDCTVEILEACQAEKISIGGVLWRVGNRSRPLGGTPCSGFHFADDLSKKGPTFKPLPLCPAQRAAVARRY